MSWLSDAFGGGGGGSLLGGAIGSIFGPAGIAIGGGLGGLADAFLGGRAANDAYERALGVNQGRYRKILRQYQALAERAHLNELEDIEAARVKRDYTGLRSRTMDGLVSSGLYNTTVKPTLDTAITRAENEAAQTAAQRVRRERLNYDMALTQPMLDVMERRTDAYPDINALVNLQRSAGQGGLYGNLGGALGQAIGGLFRGGGGRGGTGPLTGGSGSFTYSIPRPNTRL